MKTIKAVKCPLCGFCTSNTNPARFTPPDHSISLGEVQIRSCDGRKGLRKISTHYLREHANEYPELTKAILDRMSDILLSIVTHPPKDFDYRPKILVKMDELKKSIEKTKPKKRGIFKKTDGFPQRYIKPIEKQSKRQVKPRLVAPAEFLSLSEIDKRWIYNRYTVTIAQDGNVTDKKFEEYRQVRNYVPSRNP